MRWAIGLALVLAPITTQAQTAYPPSVSQADLSAVQALIPTPAATIPNAEVVGGAAGTAGTYRPGNATQPRITRAANCTLDTNGACSITWATALSASPMIVITPVNTAAAQPMSCNTTALPTATAVSIKCWIVQNTLLSLAIVTAGINIVPAVTAPSGTVVQITAIPPTQ